MVLVRETPSTEDAPSDRNAGRQGVVPPTTVEDLDEPLDPVIGIVIAVVGGSVIWLLILFVSTQIF